MNIEDVKQKISDWNAKLQTQNPDEVVSCYSKNAILLPTLSNQVRHNHEEIRDYFVNFVAKQPQCTVEEHNVIGGLGSAVSEYLSRYRKSPLQLSIGINDFFPKPGEYQYMLQQCGLTPEQIAQNILSSISF